MIIKTAIVDNGRYETFHVGMKTFGLLVTKIEHHYSEYNGDQDYTTIFFDNGSAREYFKTVELDKEYDSPNDLIKEFKNVNPAMKHVITNES